MAIELANTPTFEFKNAKLRKYTEQIFKQGLNIKKAYACIAVTLAQIDDSQCYQVDGFKSADDYAEQILGIKYAQSRALIRVGRDYIDNKSLESVLNHPEGKDFTCTQIQALFPLKTVEAAQELAENEIITPDMTVAEIKEIVNAVKNGSKSEGESEGSITENETPEIIDVEAFDIQSCLKLALDKDGKPVIIYGEIKLTLKEATSTLKEWMKR